jgi:hypothetical protein
MDLEAYIHWYRAARAAFRANDKCVGEAATSGRA